MPSFTRITTFMTKGIVLLHIVLTAEPHLFECVCKEMFSFILFYRSNPAVISYFACIENFEKNPFNSHSEDIKGLFVVDCLLRMCIVLEIKMYPNTLTYL